MSAMPIRSWMFALLLLLLGVTQTGAEEPRRLKILTSIAPIYSWVVNVAGDRAEVQNLLPPNVGPHDFQFRPRDLRKIREADLIVLNGLGLESWFTRAIAAEGAGARRQVLELASAVPTNDYIRDLPVLSVIPDDDAGSADDGHDHSHAGDANPHLWLDPVYARYAVSNILTALQRADPANANAYATNAAGYQLRLLKLEEDLRQGLSVLPRREIVTFHDAFPYFCRRFGLRLVGVIEEVPGASPSPRYLADLSKAIRENQVAALFVEPNVEIKLANQLARDLKVGVAILDTLEAARLDGNSYEVGMRSNLRALQQALK